MKKLLVVAAALLLAAPAAAQQAVETPSGDQPAVTQVVAAQEQEAQQDLAPTLFVSRAEIQQRVAAMEAERNGAQIGSQSFWYLVAAIALGVLIALLLLD